MTQYLAVFTGSAPLNGKSGWDSMDPAKRKEVEAAGIQAWYEWMQAHHDSIVVNGAPLGKTKRVSTAGIADAVNNLCGYVVVEADSYDKAAKMFENHPHFSIFPGDGVEIMECLPIPGA